MTGEPKRYQRGSADLIIKGIEMETHGFAEQRLDDAATAYIGLPAGSATPSVTLPVHSPDGVKMAIENCREAGFDEVIFIPLNDDLGELDRLEEALEGTL